MRKLSQKGSKMEQNWQGPYEVVEKVGDGNYQLRKKGSKATMKTMYNSSRLKPFQERTPSVPEQDQTAHTHPTCELTLNPVPLVVC